uniref:P-loop containing nucleoside triphosphate hydrolase protein n=1 Tax=Opuntia streptacantha TaxID=393608 RepID=A0A7C8YL34_OPUST
MIAVIVAMKGHPGTGKSTIAEAIATSLRCPLLDKDDIRDATLSLSSATSTSALNDLSYDALWRIAATQIRLGLSVVLDSPLSRRHHLDRILTIAGNHSVFIVECRPSDLDEWRRRLERRGAEEGGGHKPATWQDLERLLEVYGGCSEYDVGEVPRLVVDTTGPGGIHGVLSSVMEFIDLHRARAHAHHQQL